MWRATKGHEPIEEQLNVEKFTIRGTLRGIMSLMKTKPYVLIILSALFCNIYMTLFNSDTVSYTHLAITQELTEIIAGAEAL